MSTKGPSALSALARSSRLFTKDLVSQKTAIDSEYRPGDEASCIAHQIRDRFADIGWFAATPERRGTDILPAGSCRLQIGYDFGIRLGENVSRCDGVHADLVRRQLQRHRLRQ